MSRIEEAFKRAAKGSGVVDAAPPHRDRFAIAAKPRVRIDDFVAEAENGVVRESAAFARESGPAVRESAPPELPLKPAAPVAPAQRTSFLVHVPEVVEGKLVSLQGTDPTSVEQYRKLAATLHGLQQQNGTKVLMVTSSLPREGKTLTSTNLSLTLSQSYKRRVLLIDGDLRRPFVHEIFGIRNETGLGDGLRSEGVALPLVQVAPGLTVLPAGRPDSDPMAGLASPRMRAVLAEAAERFDWVILDTPPVGLLSDASLMAALVDGVIFVIGAGTTDFSLVERSVTEIGRERIIGTVLNRVEQEVSPASGYYGYYTDSGANNFSG